MDGAGGADGRADTLRDSLAHRQRHQPGRYAERVLLWCDHAGDGPDEYGVRHPGRALFGLCLDGIRCQPALCHVSQHPAVGLLGHRQIRHIGTDHAYDYGCKLPAECVPTDTGRECSGTFQTGALDTDVSRDRRPSVAGVPRGTGDIEFLAIPYYNARSEAIPTGVCEVRRTEPERAGECECHQTGESVCARGL